MINPTTIEYLHIDKKGGPAVKNCLLIIKTDDEKVEIGLTSKDVDNLADFVCHHSFTQIETEGKIKLSIGMIKRAIKLWIPSFIRKSY
tara:strand:- start:595 stop:858 length:264 start_codon:yes stop_codon:yes gene_type:complete